VPETGKSVGSDRESDRFQPLAAPDLRSPENVPEARLVERVQVQGFVVVGAVYDTEAVVPAQDDRSLIGIIEMRPEGKSRTATVIGRENGIGSIRFPAHPEVDLHHFRRHRLILPFQRQGSSTPERHLCSMLSPPKAYLPGKGASCPQLVRVAARSSRAGSGATSRCGSDGSPLGIGGSEWRVNRGA
jgi:hypothetical protein